MNDLKAFRRSWSADHKQLRVYLKTGSQLESAKALFQSLHGVLHSSTVWEKGSWSYADYIFADLTEDQLRKIPENCDHSLVWILWHISRIEDLTMNILVADSSQIYQSGSWREKLKVIIKHSGNLINNEDLLLLSQGIDIEQLFEYRNAVGKGTQKIIQNLTKEELTQKTPRDRLDRILNEGAVLSEAQVLIEYWSRKKIYQLLLMPPSRHLMVHLNEALILKSIIQKS